MMALWPSMIGIQKLLSPHFHLPYMVNQKLLDKKLYVYSHLFLQSHILLCLGEDGAWRFCFAYFLYYPSKHMWIAALVEELKKTNGTELTHREILKNRVKYLDILHYPHIDFWEKILQKMRLKVEVFSPFLGILLSSVSLQKKQA